MPGPKPPAVLLSEEERQTLHTMIRARKTPQHLSFRAQVILLLAEGLSAPDVARRLGTTRATVRRWRRHWLKRQGCSVPKRLHDAARPGAPATFRHVNPYGLFELDMTKRLVIDPASVLRVSILDRKKVFTAK